MDEEIEKYHHHQGDKESLATDKIPLATFPPNMGLVTMPSAISGNPLDNIECSNHLVKASNAQSDLVFNPDS